MKKTLILVLVGMFLGLAFGPAFAAEEFTYEDGKVDVLVPDKWTNENGESRLSMYAPDKTVEVHFELAASEDVNASLEGVEKEMVSNLGEIKWQDAIQEKIGGMAATTIEGAPKKGDIHILVSIIKTPAKNALCFFYIATKAGEEKHAAAIAEIINGIKPIKK